MMRRLRASLVISAPIRRFSGINDGKLPVNSPSIPLFVSHQVGNEHEDIASLVDTFTAPGTYSLTHKFT